MVYVWCPTCEARSHRVFYTAESDKIEAAERWNRREPMDKIVKQLEAEVKECWDHMGGRHADMAAQMMWAYRKAIEIVKGGAV